MKLWLLRPVEGLGDDDPWEPWFDKSFGFVVRTRTEEEAREFAHKHSGDENRIEVLPDKSVRIKSPWLDTRYSTCVELTSEGNTEVVMRDFRAA